MSQDNSDPRLQGAVPLGEPGETTQMVSCLWHGASMEHPQGAPPCQWHSGASQQVMPLASLLQWLTITLTQLLGATNGMAEHLSELGVQVEALDATLSE